MKKITTLSLLTLAMLSFVGCNQNPNYSANDKATSKTNDAITIEESKEKEVPVTPTTLTEESSTTAETTTTSDTKTTAEEDKQAKLTEEALANANKALSEATKATETK